MHQINAFLNKGISRKTYLEFFILGLLFSPLVFFGSLYIGMYLKEFGMADVVSIYVVMASFICIGVYFYVLKVKRLHDLGQTSEILAPSHTIAGGDLILHFYLFFKNKAPVAPSQNESKILHKNHSHIIGEKILIFLMFFGINYGLLYMTGTPGGYADWVHGNFADLPAMISREYAANKLNFYLGALYFFALYFVFPYINAHYFWIVLQKWQPKTIGKLARNEAVRH